MDNNKKYYYIYVRDKVYINVEVSFLPLFFYLYFKTKPMGLFEKRFTWKISRLLPLFVVRVIRVFTFTFTFYKKKRIFKNTNSQKVITSTFCGHLLLNLRQGENKIFNFKAEQVITDFPVCISNHEVEKRINTIIVASTCKIKPNLLDWDVKKRCLIEEFINIKSQSYSTNNIDVFYKDALPILKDLMFTKKPDVLNYNLYLNSKLNLLDTILEKRIINNEKYIEELKIIKRFYYEIRMKLKEINKKDIVVVFSHGDLWEGNILSNKRYTFVIDWNTQGSRTAFFDFYFMMFMLANKNSHFKVYDNKWILSLDKVLENSFMKLLNEIKNKNNNTLNSDLIENLNDFDVYRYLFYIELSILKLECREVNSDKQLKDVVAWVNRFILFEDFNNGSREFFCLKENVSK
ncbi:hypothetical protein [Halalkalibacter alkaliphilus]|uniref:Uncharacterized protein n=1 Tax=Halalkalibacter alkaliphilus TaxID=2917993 RepID=A0A9X2CPD3_9BACI|nr:hypothetical protein [Halalkalibacter alkaliphilus]MCL7746082.1 hypothetical protein [Halalkalibacter alkaliphilus]